MMLWLNTTIIFLCSIWLPPFDKVHFKSLKTFSAFSQWGVGSRFQPRVWIR